MPASRLLVPREGASAAKIGDYINRIFEGNLTRAARELQCPYDSLRFAALGMANKPSILVLQALARHSKRPIEWWLE